MAEAMGMLEYLGVSSNDKLDKTIININFGYKENKLIKSMKSINDLCSETELCILRKEHQKAKKKIELLSKLMDQHTKIQMENNKNFSVADNISNTYITFKSM